ncbi:MAG TPA: gas vesicle protein GvpG [Gemmatimonadaceae bacterium]|nr:gas vesicle protein GvpG [Gemmatimonadaceae bacterium]
MGLLSKILFFPIAGPVAGIRWTLGKVQQVAEKELTDDTAIKQELMELQMLLELGEIDDDEYARRERVLMERLRDVRHWREQLGMGSSGGPVRVAREDQGGA